MSPSCKQNTIDFLRHFSQCLLHLDLEYHFYSGLSASASCSGRCNVCQTVPTSGRRRANQPPGSQFRDSIEFPPIHRAPIGQQVKPIGIKSPWYSWRWIRTQQARPTDSSLNVHSLYMIPIMADIMVRPASQLIANSCIYVYWLMLIHSRNRCQCCSIHSSNLSGYLQLTQA